MRTACILLFTLLWLPVVAKNRLTTAELLDKIEHARHDSIRAKCYYQLAKNYLRISADSCMMFGKKALEYARKTDDQQMTAEIYSVIGAREKHNGNYEEAIKLHLKSLAIKEKFKDTMGMSISANDIGIVYKNMNRFKEALPYYRLSHDYALLSEDYRAVSMTLSNIGTIHSALKQLDSSRVYYDSALAVAYQINDTGAIVNALSNLGEYYGNTQNGEKARECFEKCLAIDRATGDKYGLVIDNLNLGNCLRGQKQYAEAEKAMNEAEKIAQEEGLLKELIGVYSTKYDLYKELKRYPESIAYLEKSKNLNDSLINEETNKQVLELNTKYETAKKEKTIAEQQSNLTKQRYWIVGSILLLVLISLLAYFRYRKLKAEEEVRLKETIMEQQLLATKAVLEAEDKERQRIATELHDGVGQLMTAAKMNLGALEGDLNLSADKKTAYQRITDLVTESAREVRDVAHNLMPNVLLKKGLSNAVQEFLNKIDSKIIKVNLHAEGIHEKMDANVEAVLYRVIQECVNNVIKHSKASHLDISITNDVQGIAVNIEDNGIGFDASVIRGDGIGLSNTRSRIEFLKGEMEIDSKPGNGTLIAIYVPKV
jgi:two-component system NarL family sensor kinase